MAGMHVKEFTDDNFQSDVLNAAGPVLVDFWAPWCGPCRAIAPMIDELATELAGKATVGKMNIDESPNTPQSYHVNAIPTLIVFKGGKVVKQFQGGQPKARLKEALDAAAQA